MSVRRYRNHNLDSHSAGLTFLEGEFQVNSAQTTAGINYKTQALFGTGIKGVTWVATGVYRIDLVDNYFKLLNFQAQVKGVNDVANHVAIASLSNATPYVITTMGTSAQADWVLAGLAADITAQVGVAFTAVSAASGSTGTGYASPVISAAIYQIQLYGNADTTLNSAHPTVTYPYFYIQTLVDSSNETLAAADPTDLSRIRFSIMLRNSNLKGTGE